PENSEVTTKLVVEMIASQVAEPRMRFVFVVINKHTQEAIGFCGIVKGKPNYKKAEIWYNILPRFWNKGFATELVNTLLNFGFNTLDLHRIEAGCAIGNMGSIRVLEKTGFIRESHTRKLLPIRGEWVDNFGYAILEEDFNIKKEVLSEIGPHFNFKTDYILENENVLLRPLKEDDYVHLLEYSINERDIWTFAGRNGSADASSEINLKKYISIALKERRNGKQYSFIVFDKHANKYVGCTRFYDIDLINRTLQLGYTWYGKKYQGTRVNKNCKYLLLEFAFEKVNFERVEFRANSKNERSINAMKSIGCKVEGTLRSYGNWLPNERSSSIVLSILADEWLKEVKENLKSKIFAT
ncbi:MAG: GNAT family protein, partial [Bacteroidia bacterium]